MTIVIDVNGLFVKAHAQSSDIGPGAAAVFTVEQDERNPNDDGECKPHDVLVTLQHSELKGDDVFSRSAGRDACQVVTNSATEA